LPKYAMFKPPRCSRRLQSERSRAALGMSTGLPVDEKRLTGKSVQTPSLVLRLGDARFNHA